MTFNKTGGFSYLKKHSIILAAEKQLTHIIFIRKIIEIIEMLAHLFIDVKRNEILLN
ncbi:hypothetical protein [Dichelobacter nodosus]|nr:hypothetical protein [Dichelobacter nodosus]